MMRVTAYQYCVQKGDTTTTIPDMGSLIREDGCLLTVCLSSFSVCLEADSTSATAPQRPLTAEGNFVKLYLMRLSGQNLYLEKSNLQWHNFFGGGSLPSMAVSSEIHNYTKMTIQYCGCIFTKDYNE